METNDATKTFFAASLRLLSHRAYHSEEMKAKLLGKGATLEEAQEVIQKLLDYRYVNDTVYIENFVEEQLRRKPQGLRPIKQKLLQKGVPAEQINPIIQNYSSAQFDQAFAALVKKRKTLRATSPLQQKQKLSRFLGSRGFNPDIIARALNSEAKPGEPS